MKLLTFLCVLLISFHINAADKASKRFVIIGDSLTEGFGVSRELAFPALVQKKINAEGLAWRVINSGISGSTSASAVSRVKWHLKDKPDLILIALGANDGLRGVKVDAIEANLNAAVELCKKSSVAVIIAGLKMPPNYGADYAKKYEAVFKRVADKHQIPMIPFLLKDVAGEKEKNLSDGIHPNEKGHAIIAETVFKSIRKKL